MSIMGAQLGLYGCSGGSRSEQLGERGESCLYVGYGLLRESRARVLDFTVCG
jgi:hypothetical protein